MSGGELSPRAGSKPDFAMAHRQPAPDLQYAELCFADGTLRRTPGFRQAVRKGASSRIRWPPPCRMRTPTEPRKRLKVVTFRRNFRQHPGPYSHRTRYLPVTITNEVFEVFMLLNLFCIAMQ